MVESSDAARELYADWFIIIVGIGAMLYFNRYKLLSLLPLFRYVESPEGETEAKPQITLCKELVRKYTDIDVAEDDITDIAQAYQQGESRTRIQKRFRVPYYMVKAVCDTVDMSTSSTNTT